MDEKTRHEPNNQNAQSRQEPASCVGCFHHVLPHISIFDKGVQSAPPGILSPMGKVCFDAGLIGAVDAFSRCAAKHFFNPGDDKTVQFIIAQDPRRRYNALHDIAISVAFHFLISIGNS